MESKKIGTLLLTGLVTGSMLGSGIILLPPMAYNMLGDFAIFAWLFTFFLGALFAYVFIKLSIAFPGSEGVAKAVGEAFGERIKLLTSYFLIFAVCAGPTAVMMLAGEYMAAVFDVNISMEMFALILVIVCYFILMFNITSISKITLFLSAFISITLLMSSISIISGFRTDVSFETIPKISTFGEAALILFWAVVGWEVIGSYSLDVKNPKVTIKRASIISYITVTSIYLLTVIAMQVVDVKKLGIEAAGISNLSVLLVPLFGKNAVYIMSFITVSLCVSTYILFTGSCARLVQALASENHLPKIFAKKSSSNAPIAVITALFLIHATESILANYGILSIDSIVAYANVFFIANALLGIFAFMKLFKTSFNLITAGILSLILLLLLIFSSKIVLIIPTILTIYALVKNEKEKRKTEYKKI